MFEDEITLYNKKYNSNTRDYEYKRTYIKGVNIEKAKAVNVIMSGLENASSGTIYIPSEDIDTEGKSFAENKEYQALSEEEIEKFFTLQNGDIIVKGIIDYEIKEENTITNLKNVYDNVYEIVSVDDKRKGGLQHWEVSLK